MGGIMEGMNTALLLDSSSALFPIAVGAAMIFGVAIWFALRGGGRGKGTGSQTSRESGGLESTRATRATLATRETSMRFELEANEPSIAEVHFASFDERPLADVERAFDELVLRGILAVEPATPESLVTAQVPAHAGPVFRALARRYRSVRLPEVDVVITLHRGVIADDAIGGWRFAAEPEEIDIRLAPPTGPVANESGDVIFDATWSPRASAEVARHSSILHFLVRAAVGDRF
ncbi:MAG: hypothetical protein RL591_2123 [Planctomycetota bacterium]